MELLFKFIIGHALADFVLQGDTMALFKNRNYHSPEGLEKRPGFPPWYYWLTSHTLIHGGVVFLISGSWVLGLVETSLHWLIDFAKCERWINFHQDQALHIACKLVYLPLIGYGLLV
jgi:hypothetical protein